LKNIKFLHKKNENDVFTHIVLLNFRQRMFDITRAIMLTVVAKPTTANIIVVSKSNNIIFTLIY